jgi:hypothetical protein
MKVREYEGGIPDGWRDIPAPPASFMRWLDEHEMDLCSCGGEAHDECAEQEDEQ